MKLIIGLGNPGRAYRDSRHNIGFLVVNSLTRELKVRAKKETGTSSCVAHTQLDLQDLLLALPQTYMNLSGTAAKALVRKYKINTKDILVVCDDLDLDFGKMRLKTSGSSGGHKGLVSIIDALGTKDFCRLRIGIGRPREKDNPADYVLSGFSRSELTKRQDIIEEATVCCRLWVTKGAVECMNIFNRKKEPG